MTDDPNTRPTAGPAAKETPDGFARFWLAIPDAAFRIVGVTAFVSYVIWRSIDYREFFPLDNAAWRADSFNTGLNLARRTLVDLTYLLIVAGFCLRIRPVKRATDPGKIAIALVGAFWPFLPFILEGLFNLLDPQMHREWLTFMWRSPAAPLHIALAGALVIAGLLVEIWGYAYLVRAVSIVPEARVLKVTGPYRFVRHPIYFGQFLAQAGVWLVLANTNAVWIGFYLCFVALQLIRTRMEDRALEDAFGETYRDWKRRTFWFV
ncbi:MAG: isoprenylcysteine carboxylmethyltransferase family protein [Phycisphaerales bacterium]|nr:isoprenylcysteine carboxylmethyltransferase family protein [Phycisphaerales bacterium]MCB9863609.1 isoprenylcysteine carboxylmethyltransferase family protein [Phycisphaerales bacterium]